jgi:hypothetical protein
VENYLTTVFISMSWRQLFSKNVKEVGFYFCGTTKQSDGIRLEKSSKIKKK